MLLHIMILVLLPALALNSMLGAPSSSKPFSQASSEAEGALEFAVCSYNNSDSDDSADKRFELGDDLSGVTFTQQVTEGMTYRFRNVPLKESACPNSGDEDCSHPSSSPCDDSGEDNPVVKTCDFEVQWKAWQNPKYTFLSSNCS